MVRELKALEVTNSTSPSPEVEQQVPKTSKCSADSAIGRKDFHDEFSNNTRCPPAH